MPTILPLDALDLADDEIRGRFDWAVRQGHPRWLWPETSVETWRAALEQLEAVVRQVLAGALAMTYPALRLTEQLAPGTVPRDIGDLCEREVPPRVRRVIGRLAPHNAQRVLRCSLEERFMWTPSLWRRVVQMVREVHPPGLPVLALPAIYRARAWRLLHGTLTR